MYQKDIRNDEEMKRALIDKAIDALEGSYAPYSGYKVGAAALFDSGRIYTGANVENASYSAGVCAERNAIVRAAAEGERRLIAIAVAGGPDGVLKHYCMPCGICRQVMREFSDPETMLVISAVSPDDHIEKTLDELLPFSFGPHNLAHTSDKQKEDDKGKSTTHRL